MTVAQSRACPQPAQTARSRANSTAYLPSGDPCPYGCPVDLEQRGGKHVCPECGFVQPCCNP